MIEIGVGAGLATSLIVGFLVGIGLGWQAVRGKLETEREVAFAKGVQVTRRLLGSK